MANVSLSLPERSALLALMTFVGKASNADLKERYNFTIDKKVRERLVEIDFVTASKVRELRGAYVHELTEKGWRHCRDEFVADVPRRAQRPYRLLYGVLRCIDAYLTKSGLELADVFNPDGAQQRPANGEIVDVDGRVEAAYESLAARPGAWVSLTRLRSALPDVSRHEMDEALRRLQLQPQAYLIPEANQKILSAADREAAVHIGGEDKHLLSIERA